MEDSRMIKPKFGYLLPTRERIMRGEPGTRFFLDMAERAESMGYDSLWVGDSLLTAHQSGICGRRCTVRKTRWPNDGITASMQSSLERRARVLGRALESGGWDLGANPLSDRRTSYLEWQHRARRSRAHRAALRRLVPDRSQCRNIQGAMGRSTKHSPSRWPAGRCGRAGRIPDGGDRR